MKQQVFVMHGGDTHATYEEYIESLKKELIDPADFMVVVGAEEKKWKKTLAQRLGPDFEVILPMMPSSLNAKYLEWKIWFEKFIPYLHDGVIFVGHSLGATFFAKYLSENLFPKKIKGLFLIAPAYDDTGSSYSLADFILPVDLTQIQQQCMRVFIYHSKDDPVVRFDDFAKYTKALPAAQGIVFEDWGHFTGQSEFPELTQKIKEISSI